MRVKRGFPVLGRIPVLSVMCIVGLTAQANDMGVGEIKPTIQTSRYVFLSDQSRLVQTGGIAGVHWAYCIEGQFVLTVDPNKGTAFFSQVDANATDDSPHKRTLDPNQVFNMTGLDGTVLADGSIRFEGKAQDQSSVVIQLSFKDGCVTLAGRTTPPPGTADFFIFTMDAVAQRKYSGGCGTAIDPYQIATAADLIALGEEPNDYDKHFILCADIDLDPNLPGNRVFDRAVVAPDVNGAETGFQGGSFAGVFDGNGHAIRHLKVVGAGHLGLFGQIQSGAEIRNLGVVDVNVTGSGDYVGGLAGYSRGDVLTSYATGTISGGKRVGGFTGRSWGNISACYSTAAVTANEYAGGLAGGNYGSIVTCYSTGTVKVNRDAGGLVGENYGSISASYSTGKVTGNTGLGGLVGHNGQDASVTSSFWDMQTSAQSASAGGEGKTTVEMQKAGTFMDAGWDFVVETANGPEDLWWINEGKGYPRLWWEGPAGMVFANIPAGTFEMGDHDGVGYVYERPVHTVTLRGFQMSTCETTNAQYAAYLNAAMAAGLIHVVDGVVYASSDAARTQPYCDMYGSNASSQIVYDQGRFTVCTRESQDMSDHPMVMVSWYGAKAFCDFYGCRLPTEAQWEYAAQGGYHDPYYQYPWGSSTIDCSKANYNNCNPSTLKARPFTSGVGYYGPQGAYGLCDMSGNVWEWCQDWFTSTYYSVSPASEPTGPATGTYRILRGGSWNYDAKGCRVPRRYWYSPDSRTNSYGFRVCR